MIIHYPTCKPDYPEKLDTEPPQYIQILDDDSTIIKQCVDCGGHEVMRPVITELNYESSLKRLRELEEQILEINTLIAEDDHTLYLGDASEALSAMEIERDELQMMMTEFINSRPEILTFEDSKDLASRLTN